MSDALDYATWAEGVREGRLLGLACGCGHTNGSPIGACPHCGSRDLERVELPTEGTVHSETTIQVPPSTFEERGYQVVVVELGDSSASDASGDAAERRASGAKVMGRVEGDGVDIGDEVRLSGHVTEDDGHPAPLFEAT
jgi:uncharacterized OB-fold protein